ncbi:transglutaminase-like domain-containing protein [Rhodococcoides kroppenstedtii]|uniref:transglutaminase-like domain-containing protein n=1 Tax=Rhodococcoides kroppenstedtii TaxID=293050 RepID=UPI00362FE3E1
MTSSKAATDSPAAAALAASRFIDLEHEVVRAFTRNAIGDADTDRCKAQRLFAAVRDQIRYDPYTVSDEPDDYRASHVIAMGRGYCVPKAVVLTATFRAAGIPARLGFADVRNHLQTDALRELMGGTDLFVYHGYSHVYIDGRWLKATAAFNTELCDRFGVPPIEFDGDRDALLHAHAADGSTHMEYVRERGVYNDLPLNDILSGLRHAYGPLIFAGRPSAGDTFTSSGGTD